jgi:hypothetical protein
MFADAKMGKRDAYPTTRASETLHYGLPATLAGAKGDSKSHTPRAHLTEWEYLVAPLSLSPVDKQAADIYLARKKPPRIVGQPSRLSPLVAGWTSETLVLREESQLYCG